MPPPRPLRVAAVPELPFVRHRAPLPRRPQPKPPYAPTDHQRRLLTLLADGCSEAEAAWRLGNSPHTVRNTLKAVRERMETRSTTQTVAVALRRGWID